MEDRSNIIKEAIEYRDKLEKEVVRLRNIISEIKEIAEQIMDKNEFVYQNHRDIRQIIRLINESEG